MPLEEIPESETLNYIYDISIAKIKKYPSLSLKYPSSIIKKIEKDDYNYDCILSSLFYRGGEGLDFLAIKMEDNIEYLVILKNYIDSIKDNFAGRLLHNSYYFRFD